MLIKCWEMFATEQIAQKIVLRINFSDPREGDDPEEGEYGEIREIDDTISLIDGNVEELAREARRELGIRPPSTLPRDGPGPGSSVLPECRSTAQKPARKRSGGKSGEKEVGEMKNY